jgi:hypothetical protein
MTDYTKTDDCIVFYYVKSFDLDFKTFKSEFADSLSEEDTKKVWNRMVENYKKQMKYNKNAIGIDVGCDVEMELETCENEVMELRDDAVAELDVVEKMDK